MRSASPISPGPRASTPREADAAARPLEELGDDSGSEVGEVGMEGIGRQRSSSAPAGDAMLREASRAAKDAKPKRRNITVLARFRPENAYEVANGGENCISYDADGKSVTVNIDARQAASENHKFMFHKVFPSYATQEDIFDYVGDGAIESFVSGVNCSVFAYGQTGSGKTYTMMGVLDKQGTVVDSQGLIPRMFNRLFSTLRRMEDDHKVELKLNFVELYMERINDLLRRTDDGKGRIGRPNDDGEKMEIREVGDGTLTVTNCTNVEVSMMADAMNVIQSGLQRRATAATSQNVVSSRSHAILIVTLRTEERLTKVHRSSQCYLVDLAGSEKVAKTETFGMRLEEAKMINKSLFSLGQVISALTEKRGRGAAPRHIPYRDSKLTRLLQNSLGGNALTYVVVTCSPSSFNDQETLSSLRFGAKAQMITTAPVRNIHRTVEELEYLLQQAHDEINNQKATIGMMRNQLKSAKVSGQNSVPVLSLNGSGGGGSSSQHVNRLQNYVLESRLSSIISSCLVCPLTQTAMRDPVVALDGYTYERRAIQNYFLNEQNGLLSPITQQRVNATLLVPNLLMRSLFEMCKEEGLLVDPQRGVGLRKAVTIFEIFDIMGVVFDFVDPREVLKFSRINATCARAIYDRERWAPLIKAHCESRPSEVARLVQNASLPAHKLYMLLMENSTATLQKSLQTCIYSSSSISLYSSGLSRRPRAKK